MQKRPYSLIRCPFVDIVRTLTPFVFLALLALSGSHQNHLKKAAIFPS